MKLTTAMTLLGAICLLISPIISLYTNSDIGIIISVLGAILIIQSGLLKLSGNRHDKHD